MPNRIIKETINESYGLSECSSFAVDLYKRLITYADDYGRFNADTMIMRARLYPREYDVVTEEDIIGGLIELCGAGKVCFYEPTVFNQGKKRGIYGAFPNWGEHQRLRESKSKCPDPEDTTINDWYLRRHIPVDMKASIIERDGFKCGICGKYLTSCRDAKRFVKLGSGLYHIDHIVPVAQGGRATMENLRLTCPECNLKRRRSFTFADILANSSDLPQLAATCRNLQLESNTNTNPNPNTKGHTSTRARFVRPTVEEVAAYCREGGYGIDAQHFCDYYDGNGWKVGKNPMQDWKATVRSWARREGKDNKKLEEAPAKPSAIALAAVQRMLEEEG